MSLPVRLGGPEAGLEDPLPVARVDARAVVADVEHHLTVNWPYLECDVVSGETGGVLEQRREDALHDVGLDGHLHPPPLARRLARAWRIPLRGRMPAASRARAEDPAHGA